MFVFSAPNPPQPARSKTVNNPTPKQVSCDKADGNQGCNGGDQLPAMQWLKKTGGQCSEADYPYKSGGGNTGKCETTWFVGAKTTPRPRRATAPTNNPS